MNHILVVGAGFMGAGIAQVCAQVGYRVSLMDVKDEALEKAESVIRGSVEKFSAKGIVKESIETIMERLTPVKDLDAATDADLVIESILEIEDLKKKIFVELDQYARTEIPLATNTSSIPITRLAEATQHPERILGLHFFGPVPLMGLVEVVKGEKTSEECFNRGIDFVESLGKKPVRVNRDVPGFVMNRIFAAAFSEAVDLVADGIATPEDVDIGMKLGYGWNAGPFEIADNAGLDTFALVTAFMKAIGETDLSPRSDLVQKMVGQGRLGRKVGHGFYRYTAEGKRIPGSGEIPE
jgi:3-hydroxybutyryl-CoA dehydrogenase